MDWSERTDPGTEELLWQLSSLPSHAPGQEGLETPIDDDEIERYRRGELSAAQRDRFELRLADDKGAQQRMAESAARPVVARQPALRLAASLLIGTLATAGIVYTVRTGRVETAAVDVPAYTVAVNGLAERRGFEPASSYETLPGSTVRIVARPESAPRAGLEFALYRRDPFGSLSLVPAASAAIRVERGTAVLEAEASVLVGTEPGLHEFVLLIGAAGQLGTAANITRSELDALVGERGLQAHIFELRLLGGNGGGEAAAGTPGTGIAPVSGAGGGPTTRSSGLSWEFYAEPCPDAVSLYSARCGNYGEIHFEVSSSSCVPFDTGSGQSFRYPGGKTKSKTTDWKDLAMPGDARGFVERAQGMSNRALLGTWNLVIDWFDVHGLAVNVIVDVLAGPGIPTLPLFLDNPLLAVLGTEISDQHLLVNLCAATEIAESAWMDVSTVNLSLGRMPQPTDPAPGTACAGTLACHIRGILQHLKEDLDVAILAAAGNHQDLLFPASLDETIAVGSLDIGRYLTTGVLDLTWETPAQVDAAVPGYGLCLLGQTAPSGTSLSAAFLAGALARLRAELPGIDPYDSWWVTQWSVQHQCVVLSQGGVEQPYCNPQILDVLGGILLGPESGCWDPPDDPSVVMSAPAGEGDVRPPAPGLVQWVDENLKPAPEEDPCIPCTDDDSYPPLVGDLFLNLTRSMPLSSSVYMDSMLFRTGDNYYPIDLSPEDLESFARAELDGLRLPGFADLIEPGTFPSLYYLLKMDPALDCSDPADAEQCFWSSSYVYP